LRRIQRRKVATCESTVLLPIFSFDSAGLNETLQLRHRNGVEPRSQEANPPRSAVPRGPDFETWEGDNLTLPQARNAGEMRYPQS
jgi:hypothetical protein